MRSSAIGCTHRDSGIWDPSVVSAELGGPRSTGRARRWLLRSMSRQTLVAIRYSQDRTAERPSKLSAFCQARTIVSWTASSASKAEPSIR